MDLYMIDPADIPDSSESIPSHFHKFSISDLCRFVMCMCNWRRHPSLRGIERAMHGYSTYVDEVEFTKLCPDIHLRTNLEYVQGCLEKLTDSDIVVFIRGRTSVSSLQLIVGQPSKVTAQDGGRFTVKEHFAIQYNTEIDDNQYVILCKQPERRIPISELFVLQKSKLQIIARKMYALCQKINRGQEADPDWFATTRKNLVEAKVTWRARFMYDDKLFNEL